MPQTAPQTSPELRHDWTQGEVEALFTLPFNDLLWQAHQVHRRHFDPNAIQVSTLLNIKTGGCSENCGYCSQSAHYDTGLDREQLLDLDEVLAAAREAKANGATRFCMGAAWRGPKEKDMAGILAMVRGVKDLGMETCLTLGMLQDDQVDRLKDAGLDYYNHNLDTSREYYPEVVSTRTYDDRLQTLRRVRDADIKVCAGGIIGMGEARGDRAGLLRELANLPRHPESVPINLLIPVDGTPLGEAATVDALELVRTIAVARLLMPASHVRLSAGREGLSEGEQALCFLAGANSVFYGERLLTTDNASTAADQSLFARLDIETTV